MAIRNIAAWAKAREQDGRYWLSSYRKNATVTTVAGQWLDYSSTSGMPVPNFYASSPLTAATLNPALGLQHGPAVAPAAKWLHRWIVMNAAAGATVTSSQNQQLMLLDYLLYFPFIDMDFGDQQDFVYPEGAGLTRYADGKGVRMMLVNQAATLGGGQFTVTYTNQDGVPGRVTPNHFCAAAGPTGALVAAAGNAAGVTPFLMLQDGDSGVRSVQSVQFSVANGGLAALVLVAPLASLYSMEEARTTTTGTIESFGSVSEFEAVRHGMPTGRIYDDSYVHFIGRTAAGSVAGSNMVGMIETVWG